MMIGPQNGETHDQFKNKGIEQTDSEIKNFVNPIPYHEPDTVANGDIPYPFACFYSICSGVRTIVQAHWHYYIEMLYSITGNVKVVLNGECYTFNEGDLVLINAREVHSVYSDFDQEVMYIVVKFDPEVLYTTSRTVFESKYVLPFTMAKTQNQKVFKASEIENTPIPDLIKEIHDEYTSKKYGFELAVRTNLCRIFLWVLRNWQAKGLDIDMTHSLKENDILMLQKVFDYLDHNYMYDITVESVSKMCNLSYSYFSRQFKAIMGKTFTEYLNYIRVTEAEKLLITSDLNITEIAVECGFSTSSYFIQLFKHYKNVSPMQFRKKIASENVG